MVKAFVLIVAIKGQAAWPPVQFDTYDDCRFAAQAIFRLMPGGSAQCRDIFADRVLSEIGRSEP